MSTVIFGLLNTLFLLVVVSKNIQETKYIIFNGALLVDHFTITIKILIVLLTIFFLIGVMHNLLVSNIDIVEYPILIGFSTLFLLVIVSVNNLIVLYLALEGLSFMLYALTLLPFNLSLYQLIPLIKYFTSGAVSSGFLLFSILIFHAKTGSFDLDTISYTYKNFSGVDTMSFIGITAVLFGFLFKLAVFPCHM
jgi:NADH-quinone oxidoreductase subunit N